MNQDNKMRKKMDSLRELLRSYGSAAVAFSGGVDSTFLLKAAHDVLGDSVLAVTAGLKSLPEWEKSETEAFCRQEGIRQKVLPFNEFEIPEFAKNLKDRCYYCKKAIFKTIQKIAAEDGLAVVLEGSNLDDTADIRPGMRAIQEMGIASPLLECGLTKDEIRLLSKESGLTTWDKPSFACMASRFTYGEPITEEKLARVKKAERYLLDLGLRQVRVRVHGEMARIETEPSAFALLMETGAREKTAEYMRQLGFAYVSLDLEGYRTGSMNRE